VHGFGLNNGTYTAVNAPGAAQTELDKVNDKIQVCGITFDSSGNITGLAAAPLSNQYVAVNYPGGTTTVVRGLNNQPILVGHYLDSGSVEHGFYAVQSAR